MNNERRAESFGVRVAGARPRQLTFSHQKGNLEFFFFDFLMTPPHQQLQVLSTLWLFDGERRRRERTDITTTTKLTLCSCLITPPPVVSEASSCVLIARLEHAKVVGACSLTASDEDLAGGSGGAVMLLSCCDPLKYLDILSMVVRGRANKAIRQCHLVPTLM